MHRSAPKNLVKLGPRYKGIWVNGPSYLYFIWCIKSTNILLSTSYQGCRRSNKGKVEVVVLKHRLLVFMLLNQLGSTWLPPTLPPFITVVSIFSKLEVSLPGRWLWLFIPTNSEGWGSAKNLLWVLYLKSRKKNPFVVREQKYIHTWKIKSGCN